MVVVDFGSHCPTKVIRNLARVSVEKKGITKTSIIHLKTSTLPLTHRRGKASDFQQTTNHRRKKKNNSILHTTTPLFLTQSALTLSSKSLNVQYVQVHYSHTPFSLSFLSSPSFIYCCRYLQKSKSVHDQSIVAVFYY